MSHFVALLLQGRDGQGVMLATLHLEAGSRSICGTEVLLFADSRAHNPGEGPHLQMTILAVSHAY